MTYIGYVDEAAIVIFWRSNLRGRVLGTDALGMLVH